MPSFPDVLLPNDNLLTQVDQRFLGWRGKDGRGVNLPWEVRYGAYGVGTLVLIVIVWFEIRAGIPFGQPAIVGTALATHFATKTIMRRVDHERPAMTVLASFWHEVNAPRAAKVVNARWVAPKIRRVEEDTRT